MTFKVGKTEDDTDRSAMPEREPSRPIAIFDSEPIFDDQVKSSCFPLIVFDNQHCTSKYEMLN